MGPHPHRALGYSQPPGNRNIGQFEQVAQQKQLTLLLAQQPQHVARERSVQQELLDDRRVLALVLAELLGAAGRGSSALPKGLVASDLAQPALGGLRRAAGAALAPGSDHGLLNRVLGFVRVAEQATGLGASAAAQARPVPGGIGGRGGARRGFHAPELRIR